MRIKYYYLRDSKNEPRLTRCLVETEDGEIAIGSAICSYSDFPNKKVGRKIALNRALHALSSKENVLPILRSDADVVLSEVDVDSIDYNNYIKFPEREFKGLYIDNDAYLNTFERKLLAKEI